MEPATLSGRFVTLVPLTTEHLAGLQDAAAIERPGVEENLRFLLDRPC